MRGVTRAGWVAGAAALSLALAACGTDGDDEAADDAAETGAAEGAATGEVSIQAITPQNPLIPSSTNETGGGNIIDNIFTGLTAYAPEDASTYNAVAEEFETEDNQVWTITLKEGWTFHDGTPVTAQSFVDAWNWSAYGPNAQANSYFFGPAGAQIEGFDEVQGEDANGDEVITEDEAPVTEMSGLEVVDDLTMRVTLDAPFSIFPTVVGYTAFSPLPEVFFDDPEAFGEAPIGNGPYQFVSYDLEEEILLEAWDEYPGEDKGAVKDVSFRIYKDENAAYADLLANNLDIMDNIPTSAITGRQFEQDLGERQVVQPVGIIQVISVPEYVDELKSTDLRLAIGQAIDREAITDTIYEGTRIPADSFVPATIDGYLEGNCGDACVYDPEAAQAALERAGGFEGSLTITSNADSDHQPWIDAVCNSIRNVLDIDCAFDPVVDFATFLDQRDNQEVPGLFRSGWQMDYPNIQNFLAPIYVTGAGSNDSFYSNPEFDDLIAQANAAPSVEEANELYQEAERVLAADVNSIPLWWYSIVAGWSENVADVTFTPFSTVDLSSVELAG